MDFWGYSSVYELILKMNDFIPEYYELDHDYEYQPVDIELKIIGNLGELPWANFCLTTSYNLLVFAERINHGTIFGRYGLRDNDLLISGCAYRDDRNLFRTSPGLMRGEISVEQNAGLIKQISELIRESDIWNARNFNS